MQIRNVVPAILLSALHVFGTLASAQSAGEPRQPVFIYLYTRFDHVHNFDLLTDRFLRELALLEKERAAFPQYPASSSFLFNGATSQIFGDFGEGKGPMKPLGDAVRRGLVEVGYDGAGEPTYITRPAANLRGAKTPGDRWLARGDAARWFLTEFKDFVTGAPDPSRHGGLERTQEVFGEVSSITGLSPRELAADSETAHQIRQMNRKAILQGIPDIKSWIGMNMPGYGGSVVGVAAEVSAVPDAAMELYWMDGYLRLSESSSRETSVVIASQGPAALKAMLDKLDRSRPHIIRVELADYGMFLKPTFNNGVLEPTRYSADTPKFPSIDASQLLPKSDVDAGAQREEALLKYLAAQFFPANPGSRFVSASDLRHMANSSPVSTVSFDVLRAASEKLLKRWDDMGTYPPSFVTAGQQDFSLAEMFQMAATALAERHSTGKFPASLRVASVYGPLEFDLPAKTVNTRVTRAELGKICAELAPKLNDETWRPLPSNILPSRVAIAGDNPTASQFLHILIEAVVHPDADAFQTKYVEENTPVGLVYPTMRKTVDGGAYWTLKPARLDWKQSIADAR